MFQLAPLDPPPAAPPPPPAPAPPEPAKWQDAATATLEARGALVEERPFLVAKLPDHDLWIASFRDSESNLFSLMSEVKGG